MLRKTLTILSLIGLLLSVAAWGASYCGHGRCCSRVSSAGVEDIVVLSGGKLLVIMSPPLRPYGPPARGCPSRYQPSGIFSARIAFVVSFSKPFLQSSEQK